LEEIRERMERGKELGGWEEERREFWGEQREAGSNEEGQGTDWRGRFEEIERSSREKEKEGRWEKIRNSRYNRWYQWVRGEGVPRYLCSGWGESRWRRVIRFRLGNEMRGGRYWEEEKDRLCRLCGNGEETWEHTWEECRRWREGGGGEESWQEVCGRVLGEEGEGESWMREVEKERWRGREGKGEGEWGGEESLEERERERERMRLDSNNAAFFFYFILFVFVFFLNIIGYYLF